jgi:hypothetical protein
VRFLFRLAGHLGRTVEELLQTLTVRELSYWRAFDQLEPIGFKGLNYLFAQLQQTVVVASPKCDSSKAPTLEKFLMDFEPAAEEFMTQAERANQIKAFFSQFNTGKKS